MHGRNLAFLISLIISHSALAVDLDHTVSGDSNIEDVLGKSTDSSNSPYIINGEGIDGVENSKSKGVDYTFNHGVKEVKDKFSDREKM
ncbi:MAG: hypothetical protein K2Q18_08470, partial [Bdellovibrionales bacterium]|nr:hypothetical protein [Bdellovibrionales bacterium]